VNRFAIAQPRSFQEAGDLLADRRYTLPILKAGGMDVVDHLKEGLLEPDLLIDIKRVRGDGGGDRRTVITAKGTPASIRIEAGATLAEIAESDLITRWAPVLAQACGSAATPQVRHVATAAGNLLQRPRCWYYRNDQFDCLKKGGPTCYAVNGENQYHAIFGDGPCHIVHPSNLAPALLVCDGVVHLLGGSKRDSIKVADLFHMPDAGVRSEHNLERTEVVTHISLTGASTSGFYAVKEKQSFDWPLVAAAVALTLDGDTIKSARVCAAAVAPVPWPLPRVEEALKGVSVGDDAGLRKACAIAADGAKPMSGNAHKVQLLPVAVRRAVLRAAGRLQEEAHA
jgi:xanthine dehydrogenase YagS FAD-binding subunit